MCGRLAGMVQDRAPAFVGDVVVDELLDAVVTLLRRGPAHLLPMLDMAPSTCSIGVTEFASPAMESKNLLPTHTADFGPDLEFFGPGSSVLGGSDLIAAKVEEVIDLIMG
jgi:hypothetical protein